LVWRRTIVSVETAGVGGSTFAVSATGVGSTAGAESKSTDPSNPATTMSNMTMTNQPRLFMLSLPLSLLAQRE
jgi:hypothetical protein